MSFSIIGNVSRLYVLDSANDACGEQGLLSQEKPTPQAKNRQVVSRSDQFISSDLPNIEYRVTLPKIRCSHIGMWGYVKVEEL